MKTIMIRYRVKEGKVEENIEFIKKVFEELKEKAPSGIKYTSYVLPDGFSFVHFATIEGENPLPQLESFKNFQKDIKERCEELPFSVELSEIGSYN